MTPSEVVTALAALFDIALDVPVYDGPRPTGGNDRRFVLVGSAGDDDDWLTVERDWSDMGNRWTDETASIVCSAWATSGDAHPSAGRTVRGQAEALAYACEAALHADPTIGGTVPANSPGPPARVSSMVGRLVPSGKGPSARVLFTVVYTRLIT
jgi:hypothetical protein